ncbi:MAG: hypothetical protein HQM13_08870 [SAR324 cluster bacterium]|nr:hypothetical protein [SAR324 cluster bacterium]
MDLPFIKLTSGFTAFNAVMKKDYRFAFIVTQVLNDDSFPQLKNRHCLQFGPQEILND